MTATRPLDLLRELKSVFEYDAAEFRRKAQATFSKFEQRGHAARAYACEQTVRKIDETLKEYSCP